MEFRRKLSYIILLISLPAILWLYYNQVANWHYHILSNGIIVEHAHPFSSKTKPGTPFQQHHHSDIEFRILAELSNVLTLVVSLFAIAGIFFIKHPVQTPKPVRIAAYSSAISWHPLRGPPSFSF